ncbi:HipA family kinase [Phocaeicola sp.]
MKLPIYKAISFNGIILEGGHSKPWVISVNAEGELKPYVVKLYRTIDIEARNKMAAEILGCLFAEEFDLLVPAFAIIEFTEEFRMSLGEECEEILNLLDERVKFGTEYYEGTFLFAPQMSLEDAEKIIPVDTLYAFDYFICNRDRTLRKPNLLIKDGSGVLIDHEMALEIDQNTITNFKAEEWNGKYQYHLFYELLKGANPFKKAMFFNEFEFYLQSLRLNKYKGVFQQLNELGFTNLNEELLEEYFNTVLKDPQKFKKILRKSIE